MYISRNFGWCAFLRSWVVKVSTKILTKCFFSKRIACLIFNVDIYPYSHRNCQNWDFTTLLLKKALDMFVQNNYNILEIGTGHLAILSIYVAKKKKVNITAVDINPEFVKNAAINAEKNSVSINFRQSDLFSNIEGTFDIIYFNPPYVPTEWVLKNYRELYSNSVFDFTWNGGPDGCNTIKKFLKDVKHFAHKDSKVLLGVNSVFVDKSRMSMLVATAGLTLEFIISSKCNPAKVYVIKTY